MNFGKDIVVLDLEYTGNKKESYSICEIGAVLAGQNNLETKSEFEYLIKPYKESFDDRAMAVHGIPKEELYKSPPLEYVLDNFQFWIAKEAKKNDGNITLVTWGDSDIPFLEEAYNLLNRKYPFKKGRNIKESAWFLLGVKDRPFNKGGLEKASRMLGIPFEGKHHRALPDAKQTLLIMGGLAKLVK